MENKMVNANVANNSNNVAGNGANVTANEATNSPIIKTFTLEVKRVELMDTDDGYVKVNLTFDKYIPGFVKDEDGTFVAADVNKISFTRSAITRQLCDLNDLIATYRDACDDNFNRKQFSIILHGAKLNIKRTLHVAGEVVKANAEPLERDKWYSDVIGISLSKTASAQLLSVLTLD